MLLVWWTNRPILPPQPAHSTITCLCNRSFPTRLLLRLRLLLYLHLQNIPHANLILLFTLDGLL